MTCLDSLVFYVVFGSPSTGKEAGIFWQPHSSVCMLTLVPVLVVSCPSSKTEKAAMDGVTRKPGRWKGNWRCCKAKCYRNMEDTMKYLGDMW